MSKKTFSLLLAVAVLVLLPTLAHAQTGTDNGCATSPENPTAILGLIGGAAAALPLLRARIRDRRR